MAEIQQIVDVEPTSRQQVRAYVRNDKNIDLSLKCPDHEHEWKRTEVVNEKGWINEYNGLDMSYVAQEGDSCLVDQIVFYHEICHKKKLAQEEYSYFSDIFELAGFSQFHLVETSNQYCPCSYCAPWYNVETDDGNFLIGWRKRVINIECTSSAIDLQLFKDEEVTKWGNGIHAWGKEKAIEYLQKIRQQKG